MKSEKRVIVWVNGAFGSGKSTLVDELRPRWPEALVYDPEMVGYVLREIVEVPTGDFQDLRLWRRQVADLAVGLVQEYQRPVLVPMTLVKPGYVGEIFGALKDAGVVAHHFFLKVPPEVLVEADRRTELHARRSRQGRAGQAVVQGQDRAVHGRGRHLARRHRVPGRRTAPTGTGRQRPCPRQRRPLSWATCPALMACRMSGEGTANVPDHMTSRATWTPEATVLVTSKCWSASSFRPCCAAAIRSGRGRTVPSGKRALGSCVDDDLGGAAAVQRREVRPPR
jgi:hypothetical protein